MELIKYKEEYGIPISACLNITNNCNLKCRYCFVKQEDINMTLQTAKDAVDFLANNLYKKRHNTNNPKLKGYINFFGGEPMLLWDEIIVPLTKYIEKKYQNCFNLGITTNGTLFNEQKIKFLYKHNIMPLLSIDGNQKTQNYNRPCKNKKYNSFDLIYPNIQILLKYFPNTCFRMTLYEDTVENFFDDVLFAEEQGFKKFFVTPDTRREWSDKSLQKTKIELEKIFLYFFSKISNNQEVINGNIFEKGMNQVLEIASLGLVDLNANIPIYLNKEIFRCGLGTSGVSIGPKGEIFGCQEQTSFNNFENNLFYLGNIYQEGIEKEKHLNLLQSYLLNNSLQNADFNKCLSCPLHVKRCRIECPSASYEKYNNLYTMTNTLCQWNVMLYEISQDTIIFFKNNYNEYFEQYLSQLIKERSGV